MKTKTLILLIGLCIGAILFLMFVATPMALAAWPDCDPHDNNIKIMSGVTIQDSGTSTYIVDLRDFCIKTGDFSIQFQNLTSAWEYNSAVSGCGGVTINAYYRMSNHIPSGSSVYRGLNPHDVAIADTLETVTIVSGLVHDTGNTQYIYDFFPDVCRYLIIDITSGASPLKTDVWLDMY